MANALIFLTHFINPDVIDRYERIAVPPGYAKVMLVDETHGPLTRPADIDYVPFSFHDFRSWGYTPMNKMLIPGNNHFPVIKLVMDRDYHQAWLVENDVLFTGNWSDFFGDQEGEADLLTAKVEFYEVEPVWFWWPIWNSKIGETYPRKMELKSFNPVYRISNKAAKQLDLFYKAGWQGHHEATMPTFLHRTGLIVEDFGHQGPFVQPKNTGKWYDAESHNWQVGFTEFKSNLVYHPVKIAR